MESIREESEKLYPGEIYFSVTKDEGSTGNLEVKINLKGESGDNWVWQKNGGDSPQGLPSPDDYAPFFESLEVQIACLNDEECVH